MSAEDSAYGRRQRCNVPVALGKPGAEAYLKMLYGYWSPQASLCFMFVCMNRSDRHMQTMDLGI